MSRCHGTTIAKMMKCKWGRIHVIYILFIIIPVLSVLMKTNTDADGSGRPVRFAAHKQPLCWNFLYHSWIALSVCGSVWYSVRNLPCTVTIDSLLANSKTQKAFLSPVLAMFCQECPLAVKPESTPQRLILKQTRRDSLPTDMLLSAVSVLIVALPSSEIPEGLMNYSVFNTYYKFVRDILRTSVFECSALFRISSLKILTILSIASITMVGYLMQLWLLRLLFVFWGSNQILAESVELSSTWSMRMALKIKGQTHITSYIPDLFVDIVQRTLKELTLSF
jgi:hypothetical protein